MKAIYYQQHGSKTPTRLNQVCLAPIEEGDSSFSLSGSGAMEANEAVDSQPGEDVVEVDKHEDASFFRLKGLVYGSNDSLGRLSEE